MKVEMFDPEGRKIHSSWWHRQGWVWIIGFIAVLLLIKNCIYQVQPNEVAVVQRFGKFIRVDKPGLHFKFPYPIDKATRVLVDYIFKEEFGFRTLRPGVKSIYSQKSYEEESLMLTGDLNVVDVSWVVQFRIKDPVAFLFNVRNKRKNLRDVSEAIMREVIGDYTFDEVFVKRLEINSLVKERLQETLDKYGMGVLITKVLLQDVNPPDPVKPAFNEVNEAKQEKEKMINEAWEVYNRKIPRAKGEAAKIVQEAEGYATEIINRAKGDAERFLEVLRAYRQAEDITRKRMYLEAMERILRQAGQKFIVDKEGTGILPLLNLSDSPRSKGKGVSGNESQTRNMPFPFPNRGGAR